MTRHILLIPRLYLTPSTMFILSLSACGGDPILEQAARSDGSSSDSTAFTVPVDPTGSSAQPSAQPVPGTPAEPEPGIPSEPGPGASEPAGASGGSAVQVAVSGSIVAPDWTPGVTIRIDVFDGDQRNLSAPRPSVVGMARISEPGPYTVSVAESAASVWVGAYADLDGDGRPSHSEPIGWFSGNPLDLSGTISGVDLSLAVEAPPSAPE